MCAFDDSDGFLIVFKCCFLFYFVMRFTDDLKFLEPAWEFPDELRFETLSSRGLEGISAKNFLLASPNPTGPLSKQVCNL